MAVEIFAVCASFKVRANSFAEISGFFDTFNSNRFPIAVSFGIATRVRVTAPYMPSVFIEYKLMDDDGAKIAETLGCEVTLPAAPKTASIPIDLAPTFTVTLPRPGNYQLDLFVNNEACGSIPLYAKRT